MPLLSRVMIRLSLLYLLAGFTIGALLLLNKGFPISPILWSLLPAHIDLLLFGWTVQLVLGMAFWIFPRFSRSPRRGNERLAWLAFILLNLGIWLVSLSPVVRSPVFTPAGRAAELSAVLAFALHAWPRIKPTGA